MTDYTDPDAANDDHDANTCIYRCCNKDLLRLDSQTCSAPGSRRKKKRLLSLRHAVRKGSGRERR